MTEAIYEPELAPAGAARSTARDEAFSRLYERWHRPLLSYARRHFGARDAEEITQEAFARAYELLDFSRESRRQWSWLTVVARNIAADLHRHRRICDVPREDETAYAMPVASPELEQPILDEECLQQLRLALSDLPQSQSRAWWLTIAEGMTPQTIASSLACSPVSVRQALFKSRRRLALALGDYCERVGAFALPGLIALRRLGGQVRRHAGRSAANAGLGATLASSALVGALAVLVQTGPAPVLQPAIDTASATLAARSADAPATHTAASRVLRVVTPRPVAAPAVPTVPATTNVYVSKKPLTPGTFASGDVAIVTPVGTIHNGLGIDRTAGRGVICNRTSIVRCS